jgi:hypothetical protein
MNLAPILALLQAALWLFLGVQSSAAMQDFAAPTLSPDNTFDRGYALPGLYRSTAVVEDGAADSAGDGAQRLLKVLMLSADVVGGGATPQTPMIIMSQNDAAPHSKARSCVAYKRIYPNGSTTWCTVQPGAGIACPLGLPVSQFRCRNGQWVLVK